MGNSCCAERKPKLYSFFTTSKSSFLLEGYLDPSKLDIPDDLYQDLQSTLSRHWESIPKQEKSLKYLMQKGIPDRLFTKVLRNLIPDSNQFTQELNFYLKDSELPNFTPTFTSKITVEAVIPSFYLTTQGLQSLKTIMWLINYKYININYSPLIAPFCSLLLLYVDEGRCYEIIDFCIGQSCERRELLEKFFTTEAEQFKILIGITCCVVFSEIEGLQSLIKARNIDFPRAVSEIFKVLFIGHFKISFLQRFLAMFLADGLLALVKMAVGVFKVAAESVSEFRKEFGAELKQFLYCLDDDDPIFLAAQKVKIGKNLFKDLEIPNLQGLTVYKYSRPKLNFVSRVVSRYELELIWTYIPDYHRHFEVQKIFSTTDHGYSLKNLIRICTSVKGQKATILVIKSSSKDIIGGYFEHPIEICSKYVGNFNSFIFSLKPLPVFYHSTGVNELHAFINEFVILFGGGKEGIALSIDQELLNASSNPCETFANPVLISTHFEILELEVLSIVST